MPSNRPTRRFRSAVLGWTDCESGDELTVRVRASERFLRNLEPLGFHGLEDQAPGAQQDPRAGPSAGTALEQAAPGVRDAGASPPGERLSAVVSRSGSGPGKSFRSVLGRS